MLGRQFFDIRDEGRMRVEKQITEPLTLILTMKSSGLRFSGDTEWGRRGESSC